MLEQMDKPKKKKKKRGEDRRNKYKRKELISKRNEKK